MVTSRGCPYRCTFCNTPRHRYRVQSPERVCDEIESCIKLGIREIYFVDDTFNITNQRVHDLCDEIIRRGLKFSWTVRFRVKGVDRPLLLKMKEAGCSRIQLGVEQGTEEGLLRLKKDVTSKEIEQAFRLCREVGMNTVVYFMIGTPVERTRQDVLDTIEYSIRLKPDFVMYNILTPFQGPHCMTKDFEMGCWMSGRGPISCRIPRKSLRLKSGMNTLRAMSCVICCTMPIVDFIGVRVSLFETYFKSAMCQISPAKPKPAFVCW